MAHFWRNFIQVSLVTSDELATIQSLQDALNLGAFKLWKFHSPVLFDTTLRGRAEPWTMQLAVTWIGDTQLEVIQPTGGTNLYQKYLDWKKGAGIEHISIDPSGRSYDSMSQDLAALGYPLVQQAKLNAPVQLAGLTLPVPGFMANLMPTRFGYTDTFDALKISLEAPVYPPGVNPRMGVRLGAPDVWVGRERAPFEQLPSDSLITAITGVVLLTRNLAALLPAYQKFQDKPLLAESARFTNSANRKSATIQRAALDLPAPAFTLVQPGDSNSLYADLLAGRGEGAELLRVTPRATAAATLAQQFTAKGWTLHSTLQSKTQPLQFWTHPAIPFALEIPPAT